VPRPTFVDFAKTLTTKGGAYQQSGHISKVVIFLLSLLVFAIYQQQ
jgi:hypothetical protein